VDEYYSGEEVRFLILSKLQLNLVLTTLQLCRNISSQYSQNRWVYLHSCFHSPASLPNSILNCVQQNKKEKFISHLSVQHNAVRTRATSPPEQPLSTIPREVRRKLRTLEWSFETRNFLRCSSLCPWTHQCRGRFEPVTCGINPHS